jgi:hypothetical protein
MNIHRLLPCFAAACCFLVGIPGLAAYQQPLEERLEVLEREVSELRGLANDSIGGATLFLFGAFCALWAQRTRRNAWLWFFLGLLFSVVAVLVLLYKNSMDQRATLPQPQPETRSG